MICECIKGPLSRLTGTPLSAGTHFQRWRRAYNGAEQGLDAEHLPKAVHLSPAVGRPSTSSTFSITGPVIFSTSTPRNKPSQKLSADAIASDTLQF